MGLDGDGDVLGVGDGLLRLRFNDVAVADRKLGEGEIPGRTKVLRGEPLGPAVGVGEACRPKPKEEEDAVGKDGLEGLPNARGEGEVGRPKPKARGDGRVAEGKGSEGGGC